MSAKLSNTSERSDSSVKALTSPTLSAPLQDLVSDDVRVIIQLVCCTGLLGVVDTFGTVANIINIICFIKQGLKDPVNVSLLGLAVSDLCCVLTLLWASICYNPAFQNSDLPFEPLETQYLTAAWPHVMFTRITSWITALITLERCLCITMPLKVKNILTAKRASVAIVCVYIILLCSTAPVFYANRFGTKFFPSRNRTMLGLIYTDDRAIVEDYSFVFNNIIIPFGAFTTVIVCTIILVIKLRNQAKWRIKCTVPEKSGTVSDRDQKISKMVVMISTLFIACFIPLCFTFIAMLVEPELAIDGQYFNTLFVLGVVGFLLESLNSGMNIFIYYHMSSRYRAVFRKLFVRDPRKSDSSNTVCDCLIPC